jgi:hypothetical protein
MPKKKNGDNKVIPIDPRALISLDAAEEAVIQEVERKWKHGEPVPQEDLEAIVNLAEEKQEAIDRIVFMMDHLTMKEANLRATAKGFEAMADQCNRHLKSMENTCTTYIDSRPGDETRIEGVHTKMWTQRNGKPAVEIIDEESIPNDYKTNVLTISVPASEYNRRLLDHIEEDVREQLGKLEVDTCHDQIIDTKRVKQDCQSAEIPGTQVAWGRQFRRTKPPAPAKIPAQEEEPKALPESSQPKEEVA